MLLNRDISLVKYALYTNYSCEIKCVENVVLSVLFVSFRRLPILIYIIICRTYIEACAIYTHRPL